jgi:hypothetical protein
MYTTFVKTFLFYWLGFHDTCFLVGAVGYAPQMFLKSPVNGARVHPGNLGDTLRRAVKRAMTDIMSFFYLTYNVARRILP